MSRFTVESLTSTRGARVRTALSKPRSLTWQSGFEGTLHSDGITAHVSLEPGDVLRVSLPVKKKLLPLDALARNRDLPGNVRFSLTTKGVSLLVADTRLDGEMHLCESVTEIETGFAEAIGKDNTHRCRSTSVDRDTVQAALDQCACSPESIVRQEFGWELRPHLPGTTIPVWASVEKASLRIERTVLSKIPSGCAGEAVAHETLRLNSRLRHVRLAAAKERIVAEARLHGGLIQPSWIMSAARAVAFASQSCSALQILTTNSEVCQHYLSVFRIQRE